jgi:hypothetical protein
VGRSQDDRDATTPGQAQSRSKLFLSRLGSLFVRRSPLTPLAKEIKDRHEKLRESLRTLGEEQEAVNIEAERIRGEVDRLDRLGDEMETATDADIERIEREVESVLERQRSLEKATTEMEEELSAVDRLSNGYFEQLTTANVEGEKLSFEVYKLIATLATGTIVAVAAITAVLEPDPHGIWMFAFATLFLLASISGSVGACFSSAERVRQGLIPNGTPQSNSLHGLAVYMSLGGLILGVFLSSLFLASNFERLPGVADPPPPTQTSENTTSTTLGE